jgi:hypothetical protein
VFAYIVEGISLDKKRFARLSALLSSSTEFNYVLRLYIMVLNNC